MDQTILTLLQSIEKNYEKSNYGNECCILCGTDKNITKEHLFPKWVFENDIKKSFFILPEDKLYSYRLSYLPCCRTCNSSILGNFEHYIRDILKRKNKNYTFSEKENIIFWIKYLDFKFKIFGIEKACHKNSKSKSNNGLLERERNNPKNFLNELFELDINIDSLIISEAKQKNFDFFYWKEHYFSITLPQCDVSIVYFFTNKIENIEDFYKDIF